MEGLESSKQNISALVAGKGLLSGALSSGGISRGTLSIGKSFSGELKARGTLSGTLSTRGTLIGKLSGMIRYVSVPDGTLVHERVRSGTKDETIFPPADAYGFGAITVEGDPDLIPENIKRGINILGVDGLLDTKGGELAHLEVTSGTEDETKTPPEGYYGFGSVTIKGDEDLVAENIKAGVNILGVDGSFEGGALEEDFHVISNYEQYGAWPHQGYYGIKNIIVDTDPALTPRALRVGTKAYGVEGDFGHFTSKSQTITSNGKYNYTPEGFDGLSGVYITVDVPQEKIENVVDANLTSLSVAPGRYSQTFDRRSNTGEEEIHGYNYVYVSGDSNLVSEKIKEGEIIFGVLGNYKGEIAAVFQHKNVTPSSFPYSVSPDTPDYNALSSVTIYADPNLLKGNIKNGVTIFGVRGNYLGEEAKLQDVIVTPTGFPYYVYPSSDYNGMSEVKINADPNFSAANIRSGVEMFGVTGTYESPMQELTLTPSLGGGVYGVTDPQFKGISKVILNPIDLSKLELENLDEVKF